MGIRAVDNQDDDEGFSGPLSIEVETRYGHPIHEWVVTYDGVTNNQWGDGYVIHAIDPCLIFKWGITDQATNRMMSGGFGFDDGEHYLSVLLVNTVSSREVDQEDIDELIPGAVLSAVQKLHQLYDEAAQEGECNDNT